MVKLIVGVLVVALAAFAWFSLPPAPHRGHDAHGGGQMARGEGRVLSIDRRASEVTISHGPLAELGMPPMTMGFEVARPEQLEAIKPGDRVRFDVQVVDEVFTVTRIERVE
jgi:Cu(I)/Ag(I) efflux system periplasmic protein CusF